MTASWACTDSCSTPAKPSSAKLGCGGPTDGSDGCSSGACRGSKIVISTASPGRAPTSPICTTASSRRGSSPTSVRSRRKGSTSTRRCSASRKLVVPDFADLCSIGLRVPDGRVRRAAIADVDAGESARLRALGQRYPLRREDGSALAEVAATGATLYRPIVDAPGPDEPWPNEDEPGAERSLIVSPLPGRDGVSGACAMVTWSRHYTRDDVALAQEVAQRCAVVADTTRMYKESESVRPLARPRPRSVKHSAQHWRSTTPATASLISSCRPSPTSGSSRREASRVRAGRRSARRPRGRNAISRRLPRRGTRSRLGDTARTRDRNGCACLDRDGSSRGTRPQWWGGTRVDASAGRSFGPRRPARYRWSRARRDRARLRPVGTPVLAG